MDNNRGYLKIWQNLGVQLEMTETRADDGSIKRSSFVIRVKCAEPIWTLNATGIPKYHGGQKQCGSYI